MRVSRRYLDYWLFSLVHNDGAPGSLNWFTYYFWALVGLVLSVLAIIGICAGLVWEDRYLGLHPELSMLTLQVSAVVLALLLIHVAVATKTGLYSRISSSLGLDTIKAKFFPPITFVD